MNISKSLHKSRKQFASRRKRSPRLDPGSCLGYTSILNAFMIAALVMKIIFLFFREISKVEGIGELGEFGIRLLHSILPQVC